MERDIMQYDVIIVGAGPAGLSAAIRLKCLDSNNKLSVCVLEKGAEVGSHIISGAVIETSGLDMLIPDWKNKGAPLNTPVTQEKFTFLTKNKAYNIPIKLLPDELHNHNNYIVSLSNLCRWLAEQAEALGVEIFSGFAASQLLFDGNNRVIGIRTNDLGIDKQGNHKDTFMLGVDIHARYTILGEGCHGSLAKQVINHYKLRQNSDPQTYGIGIKELWEIKSENHNPGMVMHTAGWPVDRHTWGGSFIYHLENNQVYIGYVVGLDYKNPYLSPFNEMQRFKTHPEIAKILNGGKRIGYGARAINEGGIQSLPKLTFPGGLLIGCSAGFLNVAKIKGTHNAMKSGIIAADNIHKALSTQTPNHELDEYEKNLKASTIYKELYRQRNFRIAANKFGMYWGMLYNAVDLKLFKGKLPWTLHHKTTDHNTLIFKDKAKKIDYPKPDGKLTFDRTSSVALANVFHEENQPCHLQLADDKTPIEYNLKYFDAPEQRYCPAQVYEIIYEKGKSPYLQINFTNCIHCKTCDIKDPKQNINWHTPEGGGGPNYANM
ncbi:electron transfer flavoprotein-ubiquinone oxidoreductase [Facilibium subflavum]|uniref:electron transfer flavoprotein-ubiquinone oxidoreductase n=1 Tax=Facilibium subflavum TaxID=2219058 RepID=UPI000E64A4D4|nr:electron transfer flavoprotein-ubiquinone oxidoreductase [Facilibium subflavum]